MILIDLVAGAGLALSGVAVGRFLPSLPRAPKPVPPAKPICGCNHHLSYHKDRERCKWWNCDCQQYIGPVPVTEFFVPDVLPPGD